MMMKLVTIMIAGMILLMAAFANFVTAAEVELVGSIEEGLYSPTSIFVSTDGIAVLEPYSSQIKLFTADGQSTHKVNISSEAHALTRVAEYRYLFCDRELKQVMQVDLQTGVTEVLISNSSSLVDPVDLIATDNRLLVLDAGRSKVATYDLGGTLLAEFSVSNQQQESLVFPSSFALAKTLNRIYVLEQTSSTVLVYDLAGTYLTEFSSFGNKDGQITRGGEIAVDSYGRIFVADRFQGRVTSFDSEGVFLTNIGGSDDLPALATPTGLDVDETGVIYVASTMSSKIYMFYSTIFSASQLVQAATVSPEEAAILELDNVILRASAELSNPDIVVSFFDFELYDETDEGTDPIASYRGTPVIDEVTNTITCQWEVKETLIDGNSYRWRTRVGFEGTFSEWSTERTFAMAANQLPLSFKLNQNYPNPFNPATTISFSLPETGATKLEIFNLLGQQVTTIVERVLEAGEYEENWDGRASNGLKVATGIYFYRLSAGNYQQTRKMVIIK